MAVRTPLYFVSGNLREMDAGMITDLQNLAIYQYSLNKDDDRYLKII